MSRRFAPRNDSGGRPCNRAHLPVFSMSLRTSAHTGAAIRFPAEKLCQSVILKANSYPLFRIRPKYCFSVCAAAGVTDCHVASLLAMTVGGRPCTRSHASVFCMSLRASAHTGVAIRIPAEKPSNLALLRANPYALSRIRPKYCSPLRPTAGETDCPVASLLAMTGGEVSLRASALPPLTPGMFPRTLRATSLQAQTPFCLLHVIANQCAHWCGNPFPRSNTWQACRT